MSENWICPLCGSEAEWNEGCQAYLCDYRHEIPFPAMHHIGFNDLELEVWQLATPIEKLLNSADPRRWILYKMVFIGTLARQAIEKIDQDPNELNTAWRIQ